MGLWGERREFVIIDNITRDREDSNSESTGLLMVPRKVNTTRFKYFHFCLMSLCYFNL